MSLYLQRFGRNLLSSWGGARSLRYIRSYVCWSLGARSICTVAPPFSDSWALVKFCFHFQFTSVSV